MHYSDLPYSFKNVPDNYNFKLLQDTLDDIFSNFDYSNKKDKKYSIKSFKPILIKEYPWAIEIRYKNSKTQTIYLY